MRPAREKLSPKNLAYRGVPHEFFESSLDDYELNPDHYQIISKYLEHLPIMVDEMINLILYGANGNGKTYLACLIVKEAYRRRYTSFRVTLKRYIDLYFQRKDPDIALKLDEIENCDILVIDEVGKEGFDGKQYNIAIFEELLRHRDTICRPTIKCTNLNLDQLYEQYGSSIRDLIEGKDVKLIFNEESHRREVTSRKQGMKILMGE